MERKRLLRSQMFLAIIEKDEKKPHRGDLFGYMTRFYDKNPTLDSH
jgi:hypothetical protein